MQKFKQSQTVIQAAKTKDKGDQWVQNHTFFIDED